MVVGGGLLGLEAAGALKALGLRITSYNVCYTKLLRTGRREREIFKRTNFGIMPTLARFIFNGEHVVGKNFAESKL